MSNSEKRNKPVEPFKAKLRHYHRSASPELYTKKQKRWEEVNPVDLSDSSTPKVAGVPDLSQSTPSEGE